MNILPFFLVQSGAGETWAIPIWTGPYRCGTGHNFMYISYLKDCTILFPFMNYNYLNGKNPNCNAKAFKILYWNDVHGIPVP